MEIKIKKLHPGAVIPQYATDGAACFDLCAVEVTYGMTWVDTCKEFHTGLSFEIPSGYAMLIFSRSGHGFKNDARLSNCVGVIDSDYRGEVKVKLTVDRNAGEPLRIKEGDRIAQAMVIPVPRVSFVEAKKLSETVRGAGGFGSTGA